MALGSTASARAHVGASSDPAGRPTVGFVDWQDALPASAEPGLFGGDDFA